MSTGPIAVMYSRRTSVCPSPSSSICSASRRCRSASTPSFCRPGSMPSSCCESCRISWIEITSRSAVFAWVTRQSSTTPAAARSSSTSSIVNDGGRAHPVERLVAQRVGVHEHAAVVLEHEQPGRERQVRAQPAGVVHRAAGNDETHGYESRSSLGLRPRCRGVSLRAPAAARCSARSARFCGLARRGDRERRDDDEAEHDPEGVEHADVVADEADERRADRGTRRSRPSRRRSRWRRRCAGRRRRPTCPTGKPSDAPSPQSTTPAIGDRHDRHQDDDGEPTAAASAAPRSTGTRPNRSSSGTPREPPDRSSRR